MIVQHAVEMILGRPVWPTDADVVLQDNAILHWDTSALGPQPTEEQLQAAWLEYLQAQRAVISRLAFLQRFTKEEVSYLMSTPQYQPLAAQVLAAEVVDLADETSQYARQALAQALDAQGTRVFPDARLAEIFAVEG